MANEDDRLGWEKFLADSGASDFKKNARALLSSLLSRMDLVSRQEFEVQERLLKQALAKIKVLEDKLAIEPGRSSRIKTEAQDPDRS